MEPGARGCVRGVERIERFEPEFDAVAFARAEGLREREAGGPDSRPRDRVAGTQERNQQEDGLHRCTGWVKAPFPAESHTAKRTHFLPAASNGMLNFFEPNGARSVAEITCD